MLTEELNRNEMAKAHLDIAEVMLTKAVLNKYMILGVGLHLHQAAEMYLKNNVKKFPGWKETHELSILINNVQPGIPSAGICYWAEILDDLFIANVMTTYDGWYNREGAYEPLTQEDMRLIYHNIRNDITVPVLGKESADTWWEGLSDQQKLKLHKLSPIVYNSCVNRRFEEVGPLLQQVRLLL